MRCSTHFAVRMVILVDYFRMVTRRRYTEITCKFVPWLADTIV